MKLFVVMKNSRSCWSHDEKVDSVFVDKEEAKEYCKQQNNIQSDYTYKEFETPLLKSEIDVSKITRRKPNFLERMMIFVNKLINFFPFMCLFIGVGTFVLLTLSSTALVIFLGVHFHWFAWATVLLATIVFGGLSAATLGVAHGLKIWVSETDFNDLYDVDFLEADVK